MRSVVVGCLLFGCGGSSALPSCPDGVPKELAPATDQDLALKLRASGVQRYGCSSGSGSAAGTLAWTLVVPEAKLYDGDAFAGTHFAGPSWQHADGSSAVGRKIAAATVDKTAIPWLFLKVSSHNGKPGVLSDVTQIQRLETSGGLAPPTGCDATHGGATIDVPYTANYYFYRKTTNPTPTRCGG